MSEVKVQFIHPTNGTSVPADLDLSMKPEEVIAELISEGFIDRNPDGYGLAIKNGPEIPNWQSFRDAGVQEDTAIRVFPKTQAGAEGSKGPA